MDIEANKFYDRAHRLYDAAILTRCYTQHALRPFIDSEINHIRQFIKIQFVNKGIEFINLPSIFKDKSVISSIPTYFEKIIRNPLFCNRWCKREHVESNALNSWKLNIFKIIDGRISFYCNNLDLLPPKPKFTLDT